MEQTHEVCTECKQSTPTKHGEIFNNRFYCNSCHAEIDRVSEMVSDTENFISNHLPLIFPEIKTGDESPIMSIKLNTALTEYFTEWVEGNF